MPRSTSKRNIHHPEFGAFMGQLRERAGIHSVRAVESRAERAGIEGLDYQRVSDLENGKTRFIDPDLLRTLAQLYKCDYYYLVRTHAQMVYGIDIDPSAAPQLTPAEHDLLELWRNPSVTAEERAAALVFLRSLAARPSR